MADNSISVLIVDDETAVADSFAELLSENYDCRVAYSGREALEVYDDEIDVVLLDRRMPDLSGDEVLKKLRERGADSRVAMVTAVNPDFDVVEMGFDEYLVKPVSEEELDETIQNLYKLSKYDEDIQTYFSLVTRRATIESEKSEPELNENEEYESLLRKIEEMKSKLDDVIEDLTMEDYAIAFRDIQSKQSGEEGVNR